MSIPRPATVIDLSFKHGQQVTLKSVKRREVVIAEMKVPADTEVILETIEQTLVFEQKGAPPIYMLTNEELRFNRGDVVWWGIKDVVDPPKITDVGVLVDTTGRRIA